MMLFFLLRSMSSAKKNTTINRSPFINTIIHYPLASDGSGTQKLGVLDVPWTNRFKAKFEQGFFTPFWLDF